MSEFVVGLVFLVPATLGCLYYLIPTVAASILRRRRGKGTIPKHRFAILIPAHDEEGTLPGALRAVAALDYPEYFRSVTVIADNCSDQTERVARTAGANCLVRTDTMRRGKGFALAFGLEEALLSSPDAVLILDADCGLNPGALRALDALLSKGADAVQTAVRSRNPDAGPSGLVTAVGAAVDDRVAAGMSQFGWSVPLRGTGMVFRRELLERIRWESFGAVEDAEYAARLGAAGVRVRYCADAEVCCDAPDGLDALCIQRRRWRTAMLVGGRGGFLTRVVKSKPLVLAQLMATLAACSWSASAAAMIWCLVLIVLTGCVYLRAFADVGVSWQRTRSLLGAPAVVVKLCSVTLAGLVRGQPGTWDRTPRSEGTGLSVVE